jgi:hypothetical protein
MAENIQPSLQKAGSVNIQEIKLISSNNIEIDLNEFLIEVNLYEDMFSSHLYGDIALSDSRNIIDKLPIIGEEYLNLTFFTPGFDNFKIKKTFRVFRLSSRQIVRDNNTQTFILHFASIELFYDILLPLYRSFTGKITDVVKQLFFDYVSESKNFLINDNGTSNLSTTNTPLTIINDTSNNIKFVSPGWSPFKCINWLATKSIPKEGLSKNFLFWESNKSFYFGSIEYLFKDALENNNIVGVYSYSPNNIKNNKDRDILKEMFTITDIEMVQTTDHVKNYTNGYLANRLITLDVFNKKYEFFDYDYVKEYKKSYHTSGKGDRAVPVFVPESPRNFSSSISYYPVNPKLFDNFPGNISEKMGEIYGNRKSTLLDLTNIKLNITVPGRSDIEVGNLIYIKFPALGPAVESDTNKEHVDRSYSGYYIITAIHHKLTALEHVMIMEVVKDSLQVDT